MLSCEEALEQMESGPGRSADRRGAGGAGGPSGLLPCLPGGLGGSEGSCIRPWGSLEGDSRRPRGFADRVMERVREDARPPRSSPRGGGPSGRRRPDWRPAR